MLKPRTVLDLGATGWRFLVKGTLTQNENTDGLLLNAISDGYLLALQLIKIMRLFLGND